MNRYALVKAGIVQAGKERARTVIATPETNITPTPAIKASIIRVEPAPVAMIPATMVTVPPPRIASQGFRLFIGRYVINKAASLVPGG